MEDLLAVKFTHSNTVHERRPYTIYEIEVRSSSTITWVIYKRYSSFDDLHDQLQKYISQNVSLFGVIKLPILPPKRMTRSLAAEFVEKRKMELQSFLRQCLQIPTVVQSDVLLNFLEVPDSVRPMLSRPNPAIKTTSNNNDSNPTSAADKASTNATAAASHDSRFGVCTPEEKQVMDLIMALRASPNKVAAIRQFENFFFRAQGSNNRARLSTEYIRLLFEGQPEGVSGPAVPAAGALQQRKVLTPANSKDSPPSAGVGLAAVCGDFRHSRCAARAALCLICRLCDPERNKDSAVYIDQFSSLPSTLLQKMRLQNHIFTTRGNRPAAFAIVHTLQQYVEMRSMTPNAQGGANPDLTLEFLIQEPWARQEYLKWLRVKNTQHLRTTQATNENSTTMSLFLRGNTLAAYKPLIQSGFEQLLQLCSIENGWQEIEAPETNSTTTTNHNNSPNTPTSANNNNNNKGNNANGGGNGTVSRPNRPNSSSNHPTSTNQQLNQTGIYNKPTTASNGQVATPILPSRPTMVPSVQQQQQQQQQLLQHQLNRQPSYSQQNPPPLTPRSSNHGANNVFKDDGHNNNNNNNNNDDDERNLPISLSYQKDKETNNLLLRSCALLPYSVQKVNSIISVPDLLPLWDTKVHSANVTHQFDVSSDILHLVYYTNGSSYRQMDFSLLRSITQLQDGSVILLCRSVNIPSCAEVKGYQRCNLPPSGYIISPISPQETLVTHILQLDHDSVLLYSADLLAESQEVRTSWYNLVTLLEAVSE